MCSRRTAIVQIYLRSGLNWSSSPLARRRSANSALGICWECSCFPAFCAATNSTGAVAHGTPWTPLRKERDSFALLAVSRCFESPLPLLRYPRATSFPSSWKEVRLGHKDIGYATEPSHITNIGKACSHPLRLFGLRLPLWSRTSKNSRLVTLLSPFLSSRAGSD